MQSGNKKGDIELLNQNSSSIEEVESKENALSECDSIVALATPAGFGGVAIIRLSGPSADIFNVAEKILKKPKEKIKPRYAHYGNFYVCIDGEQLVIDRGIAIYFESPNSYTGESVLELHCHGGPVVVDELIKEILKFKVRLADPGEFTKRAWLNGKMDLTQVEAVSDLINATSTQALRSAVNSLNGEFAKLINNFLIELISFRTYVEASIDFSDQDIDFVEDGNVINGLNKLIQKIDEAFDATKQGVILQEGVKIAIAGKPNAGKSSLLNSLCRREEAIVTDIPGTTRDVIKTNLNIRGIPVSLVDTAGLRETTDVIEKQGIKKAFDNIDKADFVLMVVDASSEEPSQLKLSETIDKAKEQDVYKKHASKIILVLNKLENVTKEFVSKFIRDGDFSDSSVVIVSAKFNKGIDKLEQVILNKVGFSQTNEGSFTARRRHLESIAKVKDSLLSARNYLNNKVAIDLIAEELRQAQVFLGEITGEYTPDDLLGSIFSSFCIGK